MWAIVSDFRPSFLNFGSSAKCLIHGSNRRAEVELKFIDAIYIN